MTKYLNYVVGCIVLCVCVCVCVWGGVTVSYNRCLLLFCPLICDVAGLETILQK